MGSECHVLNPARVQALETWLETTQIQVTQINGQRRYGGPPKVWEGPPPGAHCEVFISKIPLDAYEDLLIPLFSSVGQLWEFRLMMNFSGQNRGFAYAKYGSPRVASEAVRVLNGYKLGRGIYIGVQHSTEKRSLCIDQLPLTTRQNDLLQVLRTLTEGVVRLSVISRPHMAAVSAKVTYESHQAASMAKKVLVEAFKRDFALSITVKWDSSTKPGVKPPGREQKKPSRHSPRPPQHRSALPPLLPAHPSILPGFCSTVGRPTVQPYLGPPTAASTPSSSSPSPQGPLLSAASPLMLPHKSCEATEVDQMLYNWSPFQMAGF